MKVNAMCCRALFLEGGADMARVREIAREVFLSGHKGVGGARGNLAFLSHLDLLPERLEDWPADSRAVAEAGWTPGRAYFRCKALGPDGLCTIYARRPGTCSSFCASAANGCDQCASFGVTCPKPVPGLNIEGKGTA